MNRITMTFQIFGDRLFRPALEVQASPQRLVRTWRAIHHDAAVGDFQCACQMPAFMLLVVPPS